MHLLHVYMNVTMAVLPANIYTRNQQVVLDVCVTSTCILEMMLPFNFLLQTSMLSWVSGPEGWMHLCNTYSYMWTLWNYIQNFHPYTSVSTLDDSHLLTLSGVCQDFLVSCMEPFQSSSILPEENHHTKADSNSIMRQTDHFPHDSSFCLVSICTSPLVQFCCSHLSLVPVACLS